MAPGAYSIIRLVFIAGVVGSASSVLDTVEDSVVGRTVGSVLVSGGVVVVLLALTPVSIGASMGSALEGGVSVACKGK